MQELKFSVLGLGDCGAAKWRYGDFAMTLTPDHIMQTGMAFWASKTLLSAVEMELFTELAKHPADLAILQGRMGLHPRGARDFLDALVAMRFLERGGMGCIATRLRRTCFWTRPSRPTSGAFWKCPIIGCMGFGAI